MYKSIPFQEGSYPQVVNERYLGLDANVRQLGAPYPIDFPIFEGSGGDIMKVWVYEHPGGYCVLSVHHLGGVKVEGRYKLLSTEESAMGYLDKLFGLR